MQINKFINSVATFFEVKAPRPPVTPPTSDITDGAAKVAADLKHIQQRIAQAVSDYKDGKMNATELQAFMKDVLEDVKTLALDTSKLGGDLFSVLDTVHQYIDALGLPDNVKKSLDSVFDTIAKAKDTIKDDIKQLLNIIDKFETIIDEAFKEGKDGAAKIDDFLNHLNSTLESISNGLDNLVSALDKIIAQLQAHPQLQDFLKALELAATTVANALKAAHDVINKAKEWLKHFWS